MRHGGMSRKSILNGYKTYDTSDGFGSRSEWRKAFRGRMGYEEAEQVINEQRSTPHSILNISANASKEEIKRAYRKLAFAYHPDRILTTLLTKEEAESKFKQVQAAYTILMGKRR